MKKFIVITAGLCTLALTTASAQETKAEAPAKKASPVAEQRALRKELTEKYDANKSGRLDKEERAKMSPEDTEKWNALTAATKEKSEVAKEKAEAKKAEAEAKKAAAKADAEAKKAAKEKKVKE